MYHYSVVSYFFPLFIIGFALIFLMRNSNKNAPILIFLLIWFFTFLFHGVTTAFQLVDLYPSGLIPNLLVTGAVLTLSLSFIVFRSFFMKALGSSNFELINLLNTQISESFRKKNQLFFVFFSLVAFYFMFKQATQIIDGKNVFFALQLLRSNLNYEDYNWGMVRYLGVPVTVIAVYMMTSSKGQKLRSKIPAIIVFFCALLIAILSTQRTAILMLLVALLFSTSRSNFPKMRVIIFTAIVFVLFFTLVGFLVGKVGNNIDNNYEIFLLGLESFIKYFLSPLSAFSESGIWKNPSHDGGFSLRFFFSLLTSLGIYSGDVKELVLDFSWVPFPTNVYTFVFASISDFGYFYFWYYLLIGFILGFVFSLPRTRISCRVLQGFSYYPLIMSVFQDQFFAILSTWIQIIIMVIVLHFFLERNVLNLKLKKSS